MFCMRCGQQVPDAARFCAVCGQPANKPVTLASSYGTSAPAFADPAMSSSLKGVSGWLLLFCVGFTILWPLWMLMQYSLTNFMLLRRFTPILLLGPVRMFFG